MVKKLLPLIAASVVSMPALAQASEYLPEIGCQVEKEHVEKVRDLYFESPWHAFGDYERQEAACHYASYLHNPLHRVPLEKTLTILLQYPQPALFNLHMTLGIHYQNYEAAQILASRDFSQRIPQDRSQNQFRLALEQANMFPKHTNPRSIAYAKRYIPNTERRAH